MYNKNIELICEAGTKKEKNIKKNLSGFILSSMLAGMFVGFGVLLCATSGGLLKDSPFTKIIMGLVFPIALTLVIVLKVELFTSGTFILGVKYYNNSIKFFKMVKIWSICYLGNFLGAFILALLFTRTGVMESSIGDFIIEWSKTKIHYGIFALISKGILCNILVCIGTWSTYYLKEESAKLIVTFWCLFALLTCGFEHSIANMTTFSLVLLKNTPDVTLINCLYNISWVTLGNIIGGFIFIAFPYFIINKKDI